MAVGLLTFGKRACQIIHAKLEGSLRSTWPSQLSPNSISWVLEVECLKTTLFDGYSVEPSGQFSFEIFHRVGWRQIAPATYTVPETLYGTVYFHEHSEIDSGKLVLNWSEDTELNVVAEFEGDFEGQQGRGRLETIASFDGIRVLDVGPMAVDDAAEILMGIIDIEGLVGERLETRMVDGRAYADILFRTFPAVSDGSASK